MSTLKLVAKFAFAFGILIWMVTSGRLDLAVVRQGFSHGSALAGSAALILVSMIAAFYRWGELMRGQGIPVSGGQIVRYSMIGAFFNTTMPGAVSGDLIKAWYVVADRKGQPKAPVLTTVLLDRVLGVFGLVIVSAAPILFFFSEVWAQPQLRALALPVLAGFAGVVAFLTYVMLSSWGPFALLRRKVDFLSRSKPGATLLQCYDALVTYRRHPWILAQAVLLSIGNFLSLTIVTILCSHAIGDTSITAYQYFMLVPIGLLATAIPVAPAGLGVGHVAFDKLFKLAGSGHGAEIFTMVVTLQIAFNLCGAFFYLRSPKAVPDGSLETLPSA